ncbi:1-deoxy-D-xylulose-5-phosphate synthase [bacterium]|nr:1-deoxy-D-xylulose-5-phosphate synthase [bacterium]
MLLDGIHKPHDVAALPVESLPALATEIREEIIRVCAQNGGHLAASLGAVDLAVAVHHVFPGETTRIVWDTGHQAYAHKLLTGRRERFDTLRRAGGLSGFLKRRESPYDHFGAGHACTALSAALGFSQGARLRGEERLTIAILGDGAATGGMVYEAINNARAHAGRLLVILNDNEMSISPNVGSISRILTHLTATRTFLNLEGRAWRALGRVPRFGKRLRALASRTKYGLKHLVLPSNFFEDFGFKYFGPLDGHDIPLLVRTLRQLARIEQPVFLHVLSRKGKGCDFAESNPAKYHGFAPFVRETGVKLPDPEPVAVSYTQAFGEALVELAAADPRIVAITAAMPDGTGLTPFAQRFPERFFDVGIAEPHAVTFAAGLAADGLRPVVAIYSTFLQRAFDQIVHDVALQQLPVVFAIDRAGLVGEDGPTHHGALDLGYLSMIPGLTLMAPSDENELRRMLATAAAHSAGPIALRYPRGAARGLRERAPLEPLPLGRSLRLQQGEELDIWALGSMVAPAEAAVRLLAARGLRAGLVDARFLAPLDTVALDALADPAGLLVTVEENSPVGGFGEAVLRHFRTLGQGPRLLTLSLPHAFCGQGTREELLAAAGLDAAHLAGRIEATLLGNRLLADRRAGGRPL